MKLLTVAFILLTLAAGLPAAEGKFVDLGIPVLRAGVYKQTLGPDERGEMTKIYAIFTQDAAPIFLVQIDPYTGVSRQYNAPIGTHPWGLVVGPDNCVYIGTAGEEAGGGLLLRFDPARPEKGMVNLGKMAESETYVWALARGEKDGCIYGCSYGNGKITAYNTDTGRMRDYGQMKPGQQYTRPIVVGKDGWVYTGAGTTDPDYIALNPRTGEHHSSRPAELAGTPVAELARGGWGGLRKAVDGNAYQLDNGKWYRLIGGKAQPIAESEPPAAVVLRLKDGRELVGIEPTGEWTLRDPASGRETSGHFEYRSEGMRPFVLGEGPDGDIYGSTILPLWLFRTDPRTGKHEVLGKSSHSGGELYSMLPLNGILWMFAYPEAYVSSYDPKRPWNFGDNPENNPRNFGPVGEGHLRPRALILGPEQKFYVGSFAPYGELGGSMGVFDPALGKTVENYRHLIRNQSISALAFDPKSNLVFGGSNVAGGGGTAPSEHQAIFFVWDPVAKKLVQTAPLVPGDIGTPAMAVADGKVFVVTLPSNTLSVWDIASKQVVDHRPIDFGTMVEISMGTHTDGIIYGLTRKGVIRIDPKTNEIKLMAEYEPGVNVGWVMNSDGIYFGSGVHLIRWEWPR
jgi:streptogramin lyase